MTAPTYDLGKLHGGLRLQGHKQASTTQPILDVPVPSQLVLPIEQHVGEPAQPVVGVGDYVLKGQLIAEPDGELGAPVHASSSGTVVAIERWPVSRRHGDKAPCIVIECDGKDAAVPRLGHYGLPVSGTGRPVAAHSRWRHRRTRRRCFSDGPETDAGPHL